MVFSSQHIMFIDLFNSKTGSVGSTFRQISFGYVKIHNTETQPPTQAVKSVKLRQERERERATTRS